MMSNLFLILILANSHFMKTTFTLLFSCLITSGLFAQAEWNVPKENTGFITKITATWCGPCGLWGWEAMEDIMATHGDDHIVTALYAPSSSKLYNAGAEELAQEIGYGGTPNFAGNGLDQGTAAAMTKPIVDTFANEAPVIANSAFEIQKVDNDTLIILVKTKFFENVDGTFILKPILVENHVMEEQTGHTGDASHHNVHRGIFSPLTDSTNIILAGSASAGDIISKKYIMEYDPSWDLDEMFIATTLWMKSPIDPLDLLYVNGSKVPQAGELAFGMGTLDEEQPIVVDPGMWPVGINEVSELNFAVFPNPATDLLNVKFSSNVDFTITISDILGKQIFAESYTSLSNASISVVDFPEGIYMLQAKADNISYYERVIVK